MYVEHWCEEQFKTLTVGGPDFSHNEMVSCTEYVFYLGILFYFSWTIYYITLLNNFCTIYLFLGYV